jgi:hypothetical protein
MLFLNTVEFVFRQHDLLEQKNEHLAQLRDYLLLMLMIRQGTVADGQPLPIMARSSSSAVRFMRHQLKSTRLMV